LGGQSRKVSEEKRRMKVSFLDLNRQYQLIKGDIDAAIGEVFGDSAFSDGPFVRAFEKQFAEAHGSRYCSCVNSGTAAIHIALWSLGVGGGDEVIVPANTFVATAEAVSLTGATPVFVDCEEKNYTIEPDKIEQAVTERTKAIIAVHLYGQPSDMDRIIPIANKHGLFLIEDCAQSHLAKYKNSHVGTFGECGCFSFYPSKNLGAYGEGGAVVTNFEHLYKTVNAIKNHGSIKKYYHDRLGHNYRMNGLQGAVLSAKLKYLPSWIEKRRANAALYRECLSDVKSVVLPNDSEGMHTYSLFVIRAKQRDELAEYLGKNQIHTGIHYPIPCHLQKAYSFLAYSKGDFPVAEKCADEVLSLPMYPELEREEIVYVCDTIRNFYKDEILRCNTLL
jgi:dTDP-4-amino-4,6-dideoxygalactose transaminase